MKYFETRQNGTGQTEEALEIIFKSLSESFLYKWLNTPGTNPLQQLWHRRDAQATNELYAFGDAVLRLKGIDPKWLADQIKHIKSDHPNNRNGAFFEINAIAMLATGEQEVTPAKGNNPGFDAILKLTEQKTMRVSLKNYGDSTHFQTFQATGKKFEEHLKKVLKTLGIVAVQILIDKISGYPEKADWQQLTDGIEPILRTYRDKEERLFAIDELWAIVVSPLLADSQPFHSASNSYILIIAAPYHKNEHKNLLDKLDEAAANLVRHSKGEDHEICNIAIIHIPEAASITSCKNWAEQYLIDHPDRPLTGIILYQPVMATDPEDDKNFIHHGVQLVFNAKKFETWNTEGIDLKFSFPIGILNSEPSSDMLIVETDGMKEKFSYKDKYFFQRGNIYVEGIKDVDGNLSSNIQKLSSGVFTHSVFQILPNEQPIIFSGRFAPVDKLLIL